MSGITSEAQQDRMLVLGDRMWALATPEVAEYVPEDATDAETLAAFGQMMTMAALSVVDGSGKNGCPFVTGIGYAIGSLMHQAGSPAQKHIREALLAGISKGRQDAARAFAAQGRA